MIECSELSGRMPDVVSGRSQWSPIEATHMAQCADCAAEWRIVRVGSALHAGLAIDTNRLAHGILARLRAGGQVVSMPRLPWRNFALGLAAAASVALAVWVPSRAHPAVVVTLPARIGPLLPSLSNATDEQLVGISLASEGQLLAGVPGTVPHLGGLTADDLEELSSLTETP
jgi:hypothetical protein